MRERRFRTFLSYTFNHLCTRRNLQAFLQLIMPLNCLLWRRKRQTQTFLDLSTHVCRDSRTSVRDFMSGVMSLVSVEFMSTSFHFPLTAPPPPYIHLNACFSSLYPPHSTKVHIFTETRTRVRVFVGVMSLGYSFVQPLHYERE